MGALDIKCITLAGSRFFAMAYTLPSSMAPARNYDSLTHAVLIQSNPNPKNITDLSWSLVSAWPRDAIVRSDQYSSHVCHTDPETGVFTVMSNFSANIDHFNYQDLAALETPLRLPGGFQYTPPERRGIEGGDPWRDIRLSQGYQWGNVSATYDVFRWPGSTSIFHARIGNATIGTIRIAEVTMIHETTIGGPKLSIDITNYTLNPDVYGYPMKVAFANNSIYQLGRLITDRRTGEFGYFLTQIPLSSEVAAPSIFALPKNLVAYDASAIANCQMEWTKIWYSSLWETLYVICTTFTYVVSSTDRGNIPTRHILVSRLKNGDKALSKPTNISTENIELLMQPIEASNSSIWVYMGKLFGYQGGFFIDPASGSLERFNTPFTSFTIPEPFGENGTRPYLNERGFVLDRLALIIAGAVFGFLLVMMAICYIPFRRRWRQSWRGKWVAFKMKTWPQWMRKVRLKLIDLLKEKDTDDNNNERDADDADSQALQGKRDISKESEDGLNNNKFEDHSMTSLDGLDGCDKILVTDDTDLSWLENPLVMDVATGYMNGVRLEAHPRPGVVTSLAIKDKRGSGSGSLLSSFEGSNDSSPPPGYPTLVVPSAPPLSIASEDNIGKALTPKSESPHKFPFDTKLPI